MGWESYIISTGRYVMDNKGSDVVTTFIGGCFTLIVMFILFTLVVSVIA